MGVLSSGGLVAPKFSAPPSGETMRQTPKVSKVQERADIRGGNRVSQVSCILDSTCNKNFDGEFGEL